MRQITAMDVDEDAAAVQQPGQLGMSSMDTSAGEADIEQEVAAAAALSEASGEAPASGEGSSRRPPTLEGRHFGGDPMDFVQESDSPTSVVPDPLPLLRRRPRAARQRFPTTRWQACG